MGTDVDGRSRRPVWWRPGLTVVALTAPGLGFGLPFLGPWLSMLLIALVVPAVGPQLWSIAGPPRRLVPVVACAALWLPGLLGIALLLLFGGALGSPDTAPWLVRLAEVVGQVAVTFWLFLPLAGPEDMLTPAAVAVAALASGAAVSARVRRPWPWLVGALAAPLAYAAAVQALGIRLVS